MGQSKDEAKRAATPGVAEDLGITWTDENGSAIEERRAWIKANGMPLVDLQVLKLK
jgi:hypothetical protein